MRLKIAAMVGSVPVVVEIGPAPKRDRAGDHGVDVEVGGAMGLGGALDGDSVMWGRWHDSCRLAEVPAVLRDVVAEMREMTPPDSEQVTTEQVVDAMEMLIAATVAAVEGERCT